MEKPPDDPVDRLQKAEQPVEHFSPSEQEKEIKEVFKLKPELKTVTSDSSGHEAEKLYAEYLKTIFPESKVPDIVWHFTDANFNEFDRSYLPEYRKSKSFWFTNKKQSF